MKSAQPSLTAVRAYSFVAELSSQSASRRQELAHLPTPPQAALERHGLVASMSPKGDCWDNAVAESFFATLRAELVDHERYVTHEAASASIGDYRQLLQRRATTLVPRLPQPHRVRIAFLFRSTTGIVRLSTETGDLQHTRRSAKKTPRARRADLVPKPAELADAASPYAGASRAENGRGDLLTGRDARWRGWPRPDG